MSTKSWKDHLLSSGVPLEHSVEQTLKGLGLVGIREYKYVRPDERGTPTGFSVDVHAAQIDLERDIWLELLVECKYRHPGTRWVLCPEDYRTFFGPEFGDAFITLDLTCTTKRVNSELVNSFAKNYPLTERGIELLPADGNPKAIRQAIEQLRYASVVKAAEALAHQAGARVREAPGNPIVMIVPVLVTTAELWRLRSTTTVESIQNATDISEIADPHDIVIYREEPDNLAERYTTDQFSNALSAEEKDVCHKLIEECGLHGWNFFCQMFARRYPAQFVVIRYPRFEQAMKNLMRFFERSDLIVPRTAKVSAAPRGEGAGAD